MTQPHRGASITGMAWAQEDGAQRGLLHYLSLVEIQRTACCSLPQGVLEALDWIGPWELWILPLYTGAAPDLCWRP